MSALLPPRHLRVAMAGLLGLFLMPSPAAPLEAAADVVFVCDHGSVKSLIAAEWFNRLAAERGSALRAVSRGLTPDAAVPPPVVAALRGDGFDVGSFRPRAFDAAEASRARRVVSLGAAMDDSVTGVVHWDGIPPATLRYEESRSAIRARVEALLRDLEGAKVLPVLSRASEPALDGRWQRIHSTVLNEDREYQVRLPESYRWAKERRYPVLYLLDGDAHVDHTAASAAFLAKWGEIPEAIVVAVRSTVRVRDFTQSDWPQAWIGGGGAANFKRFLSAELIPEIEKSYRADGFRILYGHSAAGQFALYCLTAEPALFQAYFALSPSLDWDDNLPQRSLEKAFQATPRLAAFLYVARSDDTGRALSDYERLVRTLETTSPRGFRWKSRAFPDERHTTIPLLAEVDALRQLYDGYRFHEDVVAKGLPFAEQHFRRVSKTLGWPVAIPEAVLNDLGYAALSAGKTAEAIELFQRNVKANPGSANAWDSLADGYAEAGDRKAALDASRRAAALATEHDLPIRSRLLEQVKKRELELEQPPKKN